MIKIGFHFEKFKLCGTVLQNLCNIMSGALPWWLGCLLHFCDLMILPVITYQWIYKNPFNSQTLQGGWGVCALHFCDLMILCQSSHTSGSIKLYKVVGVFVCYISVI